MSDGAVHPAGVLGGELEGPVRRPGQADDDGLVGAGRVEDGEGVGDLAAWAYGRRVSGRSERPLPGPS